MRTDIIGQYLPLFEKAAVLTLKLGFSGIAIAALIGLACALIRYWRVPIFQRIAAVYIEISRNTPSIVQLFFIYYGLPKIGFPINRYACAVTGIAFLGGSYMTEAFRSGLESVDSGQSEAGLSLGMTKVQVMRYIIFPQALSVCNSALIANMIFLLKETSVFSAIGVMDLMFTAKDLIGMSYNTTESLFLLVVFYLLILLPISVLGSFSERRLKNYV